MLILVGIGYAVAEAVIEHGARVIISSSNAQRVQGAVQFLELSYPSAKGRISGHALDMNDESTVENSIIRLLQHAESVDHIVYTAGDGIAPTPVAEATLGKIKSAATVRYIAPVLLAKHAPKYLKRNFESSITLTTGVVTEKPISNWSVIAGPRSAVVGLGKNLALDLKPVRVKVIAVGAVDTNTWSHLTPEMREEVFSTLVSKSTTGRIARASDVAEAYIYCMKDENMTGSVISTDRGALLV